MRRLLTLLGAGIVTLSCGTSTRPVVLAKVSITPRPAAMIVCDTLRLSVVARDIDGSVVQPDSVRWRSADTTLVAVFATGLVKAIRWTPRAAVDARAYLGSSAAMDTVSWPIATSGQLVCPPG